MGLVVRRGILLNLLNPKLTVFFFAFLPQFLDTPPGLLDARLIGLGGIFMLMTLAVFAVHAYASAAIRDRVLGAPVIRRWLQRSLGTLLIGFAARLAVTDR
jgi:threonine/homoserine/homoserine lactone efflux protein